MKKLIFVIAGEGFQIVEYETPKAILEKAGIQVVTVSDRAGEATSSSGKRVKPDLSLALSPMSIGAREKLLQDYDGLFIVGGEGALEHLDNEMVYKLLQEWQKTGLPGVASAKSGRPYGAICISPRILSHAGVLQGKKATGWNGDNELSGILSAGGAAFVDKSVVVDGNVVTGNGPGAAGEWGEEIVKILNKN